MAKPKLSIELQRWLQDIPLNQVVYLAKKAEEEDFDLYVKFILGEAERRKNIIWKLPENDPVKLAVEKAALRGGIEALYSIVSLSRAASDELERRAEFSKEKRGKYGKSG